MKAIIEELSAAIDAVVIQHRVQFIKTGLNDKKRKFVFRIPFLCEISFMAGRGINDNDKALSISRVTSAGMNKISFGKVLGMIQDLEKIDESPLSSQEFMAMCDRAVDIAMNYAERFMSEEPNELKNSLVENGEGLFGNAVVSQQNNAIVFHIPLQYDAFLFISDGDIVCNMSYVDMTTLSLMADMV